MKISSFEFLGVKSGAVALASALSLFVAHSAANAGVIANTTVSDGSSASTIYDFGVTVDNTTRASVSTPSGETNAAASATYGIVKASTSSSISGSATGASGYASAKFDDNLKLSNAELNGKQGRVTLAYYFTYDASVTASGGAFSNGNVSVMARAGNSYAWYVDLASTQIPGYTMFEHQEPTGQGRVYDVPKSNYIYVTSDFTWGQYINTSLELIVLGSQSNPPGGSASFNFDAGHSGYWAGVMSASADGQTVDTYELTSLSGTDYSKSLAPTGDVPEPSSVALLSIAGLGLAVLRKKRPSHS